MEGVDGVFFLANGFAIGEKSELFWSIRAFEIAIQSNVKFFVYSSLDYVSKKGNYDEKYRCGHYDAKGRVSGNVPTILLVINFSEWIKYQPLDRMKWSILTSGPYMEMMNMMWKPIYNSQTDTYEFVVPLGDGAIPMIHLDDLAKYARWIFDNPDKSAGTLHFVVSMLIFQVLNWKLLPNTSSLMKWRRHSPMLLERRQFTSVFLSKIG